MSDDYEKYRGPIGEHRYDQVLKMIAEGRTAIDIAKELKVFHETVRKFARKRGLKIAKVDQTGESHPSWKGGTTYDRSGYLLQRVPVDGPYGYLIRALQKRENGKSDSHGYAPVHRIVMHDKLGRKLRPGEVVDHIDGDRLNNDPENLRVFASNAEHLKETLKGKVPNWTEEGFANMCAPRPHCRKTVSQPESTRSHSRSDGQASP